MSKYGKNISDILLPIVCYFFSLSQLEIILIKIVITIMVY